MSLVPTGAKALSNALKNTGKPITLLYNDGQAFFQPSANQNVAIYNAPGGSITFLGSFKCKHCGMEFDSTSERERHDEEYTKTCSQHNDCFNTWEWHVNHFNHTTCPIPGCQKAGVDFGSDTMFMQHFRNKH